MTILREPRVRVVEASPGRGQDRACVRRTIDGYLLVLADGAGGTTGGAESADRVVAASLAADVESARACVDLLRALDSELPGETTAVVLRIVGEEVFGAIVGDSEAFSFRGGELVDLAAGSAGTLAPNRHRKPLLGSGRARVAAIDRARAAGTVVVGSDGLFKYVQYARICEILRRGHDVEDALVAAARLPSGGLADDLAFVLAEVAPG